MLDVIEEQYMLTTLDNPYNPFTQFNEWYGFDMSMGYYTCSYLARVTKSPDNLSEANELSAITQAMYSIIDLNVTGNYVMVTEKGFKDRTNELKE